MKSDEIDLANFPFGDAAKMKLRTVLILTGPVGTVPEVLVACLSSVIPTSLISTDIMLDPADAEHAPTHLRAKTVISLHKLATIHSRSVVRRLGVLASTTAADVDNKLRQLLNL